MKKKKDYFTTGEFAKLCNVKKQTLFHYDAIGIFKPEIVDKNGYRYYSYTQLETFSVLTMFKDLRVPLKEVKAHINNAICKLNQDDALRKQFGNHNQYRFEVEPITIQDEAVNIMAQQMESFLLQPNA